MKEPKIHESVLVREVIDWIGIRAHLKKSFKVIDATLGTGGHTLELVKNGATVLGIDISEEMVLLSQNRLKKSLTQDKLDAFKLVKGNFREIDEIAKREGFETVDAVLFDLGVSNIQLMSPGFSFSNRDAELDMRLDKESQGVTAADLLNGLRFDQLVTLFSRVLNLNESRIIAKTVVNEREVKKIETVGDFLETLKNYKSKPDLHYGTLPFLSLRMAVNSELENLEETLPLAFELLKPGGRLMVITFHSGEELIVKTFFNNKQKEKVAQVLTKNPIVASEDELIANPKSRSAHLRILEKHEAKEN